MTDQDPIWSFPNLHGKLKIIHLCFKIHFEIGCYKTGFIKLCFTKRGFKKLGFTKLDLILLPLKSQQDLRSFSDLRGNGGTHTDWQVSDDKPPATQDNWGQQDQGPSDLVKVVLLGAPGVGKTAIAQVRTFF